MNLIIKHGYHYLHSLLRMLYLVSCLSFFVVCTSCSRDSERGLNPGDLAPAIELKDLEGKDVSLAAFRGKLVVLNFLASWCSPCAEEMPSLNRLSAKLGSANFQVVSVGVDSTIEDLIEFKRKYGFDFPVLVDSARVASKSYKVTGFPETFIIDTEGKVVLFPDPETGDLATKVIGPRNWDSPTAISRLQALIPKSPSK